MRNMLSIGINLQQWVERGLLQFHADRPSRFGLETHLSGMQRTVAQFKPTVTVVDPVTNLLTVGTQNDVRSMLTQWIIDYLKMQAITRVVHQPRQPESRELEETEAGISSLMDTWIVLSVNEEKRQRWRCLSVLKSRGMAHSNSVRAYELNNAGMQILDSEPDSPRTRAGGG